MHGDSSSDEPGTQGVCSDGGRPPRRCTGGGQANTLRLLAKDPLAAAILLFEIPIVPPVPVHVRPGQLLGMEKPRGGACAPGRPAAGSCTGEGTGSISSHIAFLSALQAWKNAEGPDFFAGDPPTDNPVAIHYDGPEGPGAWTARIRWDRVIDMSKHERGAMEFEQFEAARDELAPTGGGALYYPAGTYDSSDGPHGRGLMVRSGVVIRGEAPEGKPAATSGTLPLSTRFMFGFTKRENALGSAA